MTILDRAQVNHFRHMATETFFDKLDRAKKRALLGAMKALLAHADALHAATKNSQPGEKDRCADAAEKSESESQGNGRSGAGERAHNPASPARGPRVYAVLVEGHGLSHLVPDNELLLVNDQLHQGKSAVYMADWHSLPEAAKAVLRGRGISGQDGWFPIRKSSVAALRRLKGSKR